MMFSQRSVGESRPTPRSGVAEAVFVVSVYVTYTLMRLVVEGSPARATANAQQVIRIEDAVGIGVEREAQDWILDKPLWISFWNAIYQWANYAVVIIALAILWRVNRGRYYLLRNALMISAAIGLAIFALYPVAPPRFMPGYVDTLTTQGERIFAERSTFVNQYAAVPSFHVGWPALCAVVLAGVVTHKALKVATFVPTALLAGAVVFTGNHYVFDVVVGLAVVAMALWLAQEPALTPGKFATRASRVAVVAEAEHCPQAPSLPEGLAALHETQHERSAAG